jgi:hypothetical protein
MKTRRRQNRKRVGRKTKRGGWGWSSFSSLFGKKQETPIQVRDWEGEIEIPPVGTTPFMAAAQYDPFDPVEKQKIMDAYAKVGVEHKKEIDTNDKTIKDATKLLMDYKTNPSCLEYDTYVQSGSNDPTLKNYKRVLDIRLKNLPQNPKMRLYIADIKGLQKCSSFFRSPFKTSKADIARQGLMEVGEKQEQEWKSPVAAAVAAGGKRKKNRKTKKSRKH